MTPTNEAVGVAFEPRTNCVTCGGSAHDVVWEGTFSEPSVRAWIERHHYAGDPLTELGDARFALARCTDCRTLFHTQVLASEGLSKLYGQWIDGAQIEAFESDVAPGGREQLVFERGRQEIKHLLRLHDLAGGAFPFRMLDFGCGDGRVLRLAESLGFEAHGVDFSASREARAEDAGLRIHGDLEAAEAAGATGLDAITLFEVLEHLVDPGATLRSLSRLLRPGGILLVEVPDARGLAGAPRTFEQFRLVHPLEHVNAFTPSTLDRICETAGFARETRRPAHVTTKFKDLVRTELSRIVPRAQTSGYYRKRAA